MSANILSLECANVIKKWLLEKKKLCPLKNSELFDIRKANSVPY